jgi:hypothetical protein
MRRRSCCGYSLEKQPVFYTSVCGGCDVDPATGPLPIDNGQEESPPGTAQRLGRLFQRYAKGNVLRLVRYDVLDVA